MPVLIASSLTPASPTPSDVVTLQTVRCASAVSVLMSTTPRPVMDSATTDALLRLVDRAEARLRAESAPDFADAVVADLRDLAHVAAASPTRHAVALYASQAIRRSFVLPLAVRDRVVVDPTFATRDLVRSLHRTPRHALLVLTAEEARLFEGSAGVLAPVARHGFPLRADACRGAGGYLRAVDKALATHLRSRPSPVVLAGVDRLTGEFRRRSRATTRWAGTIPGSHLTRRLPELADLTRPVLEEYLRSREQESLRLLADTPARRTASGLDAAWLAARRERPEMLVVEEDLFRPARLSDDGDQLLAADDPEEPGVLDDVVDEVIEAVLRRGGWVALAAPGALHMHGGIALTVRDL